MKTNRNKKIPIKNPLFECSNVEPNIRRISIVHGCVATENMDVEGNAECISNSSLNLASNAVINEECMAAATEDCQDAETASNTTMCSCDCDTDDRLGLLDAILGYFESPVKRNKFIYFCQLK